MVWNAVSTRKVEAVKDACSFASVANKLSTSVAVTFVGSKELEATEDLLGLKKFFSVTPVIPGIAKFHSLEPLRNGLIRCRTYSYQSTWIEMDETSEEKGDFFSNASRNSHHTYKDVSSESSKEDSKSHDEEGDSSEEEGVTGNKGSGGPDAKERASNANKSSSDEEEMSEKKDIQVQQGLPDKLLSPIYSKDKIQHKWLSNFIIDEYLRLIQVTCAANNSLAVETLPWELFERAVGSLPVHRLLKGRNPLLLQDVVLVPCNTPESEHWTLLAVLPKEKSVVVLDSMPSNHIKHTSLDAISKMCGLLKEINSNVDLNQCKLIVNKKGDVPEKTNAYDCGVFTCLYARCLVGYGEMIMPASQISGSSCCWNCIKESYTQSHQKASYQLSSIMPLNMWKLTTLDMHSLKLIAL
ncbi:unnamed protein product [Porites lobata]|uniref:Ubiquitin-like protease family profile domain-containing protein n=1 Tax=Porites lobata TaxID=104759 RepID=A0ABN8RWE8_9CNID|nr:unnamed protein product [Porites lobata]